jgi:hypothetical protein
MEIVLRPSIMYPIGVTIFFLLIFFKVYKDWSNGKWPRYVSMIVLSIVFLLVFFVSIKNTTIDINESGLKISGRISVFISWDDIKSANYQKNYKDAGYEPKSRYWGSEVPGHSVGSFRLLNKKQAYCVVDGFAADAIAIETQKGLYLLSFKNLTEVFTEISKHTIVENNSL